MIAAGTSQLTSAGTRIAKNSVNSTFCACHTISVVMSPNADHAPPAFAATTRLMHARLTKRLLPPPTARMTPAMTSAVVRLSSTGDRKKPIRPVSQNNWRNENPRLTSSARIASNTLRSAIADTKHIATTRKKNSDANSRKISRKPSAASPGSPPRAARPSAMSSQIRPAASTTGFDLRRCSRSSSTTKTYEIAKIASAA